jgi:phosphate starvation-inducible PhoH-like protein
MERTLYAVPNAIPMIALLGANDANLRIVEAAFPTLTITVRGNEITFHGDSAEGHRLEELLNELLVVIRSGQILTSEIVVRSISMMRQIPQDHPADVLSLNILSNRGKSIRPKTANQKHYVDAIDQNTITFGVGPAGTGKTYLAMAKAVAALQAKEVTRIILTRPAVEAGEHLGFLPGTLSEKIDPYLRPLFDALHEMLDQDSIPRLMQLGIIEVAPLAYMRGRTLNDAFVILDEAQNTSPEQMKMFLTRLGFGSRMVITGDVTQIDLPSGAKSGLKVIRDILSEVADIAFVELSSQDVVRHSLVGDIVDAYSKFDDERQAQLLEQRAPRQLRPSN